MESLPFKIQLPPEVEKALSASSTLVAVPAEDRSTARRRCNGRCIMSLTETPKAMKRAHFDTIAIIRDISRSGIGLITQQQFFPEQVIKIQLPESTVMATVSRARRLGPDCFEIGARLRKDEESGLSDQ